MTSVLERRRLLEGVSIFEQLAPAELERLAATTVTKRLRKGELLFRKGDPGSHAYVIMSGKIKITSPGEDGGEAVLRIMQPLEVLGQIALLDRQPRTATASALEPSELLVIQRRDLLPFLRRNPETAIKLLETVASLLRSVSDELNDQVFLPIARRLAKRLISLAEVHGKPTPEGTRIDLPLSQGDLGDMVGATRESINKQIREWSGRGVLQHEQGYVTIRDLDALEDLASPEF